MSADRYLLDTSAILTLMEDEDGADRVDEPTLLTTARLKARFRVSFADALIAAFAVRSSAVLVHKDPEFEVLADQVPQEPLPYK